MFCPNCGATNSTEQKFCRSCGLNLESSVESLLKQIPSARSSDLMRYERHLERFGNFAIGGLGIVMVMAVATGIWYLVTKFIVTGTNVFVGVMLCAFFTFAMLTLIFVALNEGLKEKKAKAKFIAPDKELGEGIVTGKLLEEKSFQPVPTVVEDSTELLKAERRTRKFQE